MGVRFSPYGDFLDAYDKDPHTLFTAAAKGCAQRGVAYVHMVESRVRGNDDREADDAETLDAFREAAKPAAFIAAGGFKRDNAPKKVASGQADLVWF